MAEEDEIYHEVEEDIRQQKLNAMWKENRAWIIGSVVAAIVMTASMVSWREYQIAKNTSATKELITAMDTREAGVLQDLAQKTDLKHELLTRFAKAEVHVKDDDQAAAAAAYDDVAEMSALPLIGVDGAWRDLAALYSVVARLDTGTASELHEALDRLSEEGDVWRWSALEMKALLYAREGKLEQAAQVLEEVIAHPATPTTLRARVESLRDVYLGTRQKNNNG